MCILKSFPGSEGSGYMCIYFMCVICVYSLIYFVVLEVELKISCTLGKLHLNKP